MPALLALLLEYLSSGVAWALVPAVLGLLVASLTVWSPRYALPAVVGVAACALAGIWLGTFWAVALNWAAVVLAGRLAAHHGHLRAAAGAFLLAVLLPFPMVRDDISLLIIHLLVIIAAIVYLSIGLLIRSEASRLRVERQRAEDRTREQVRRDIARDLHDVIAHEVAGMVVLTQAARRVGDTPALQAIEETGGRALAAIRQTVSDAGRSPTPVTPEALEDLFRDFAGDITWRVATQEPPEILTAAHRIAAEALTNVLRHAPGARVEAEAVDVGKHLELSVRNSGGAGGTLGSGGGHGLETMRQRAAAASGSLTAGPDGDGWRVLATFPLKETA